MSKSRAKVINCRGVSCRPSLYNVVATVSLGFAGNRVRRQVTQNKHKCLVRSKRKQKIRLHVLDLETAVWHNMMIVYLNYLKTGNLKKQIKK